MKWKVVYSRQAVKDSRRLIESGLADKAKALIAPLEEGPFASPPPFETLVGDVAGAHSRRINIQHRLVYQVFINEKTVRVLRMWTHHEWQHERRRGGPGGLP